MGVTRPNAGVQVSARCQGCGACLLTCPEHAIRPAPAPVSPGTGPLLVTEACTSCLECLDICPVDAIEET